jgi:hypothetical protein
MVHARVGSGEVKSTTRIGKRVRGALYVHRDAIDLLPNEYRSRIRSALDLAPEVAWNVVRIEPFIVGIMLYDDFDTCHFPRLLHSVRVDLRLKQVTERDHRGSANPLILHRKELLVRPDAQDVAPGRLSPHAWRSEACLPILLG